MTDMTTAARETRLTIVRDPMARQFHPTEIPAIAATLANYVLYGTMPPKAKRK